MKQDLLVVMFQNQMRRNLRVACWMSAMAFSFNCIGNNNSWAQVTQNPLIMSPVYDYRTKSSEITSLSWMRNHIKPQFQPHKNVRFGLLPRSGIGDFDKLQMRYVLPKLNRTITIGQTRSIVYIRVKDFPTTKKNLSATQVQDLARGLFSDSENLQLSVTKATEDTMEGQGKVGAIVGGETLAKSPTLYWRHKLGETDYYILRQTYAGSSGAQFGFEGHLNAFWFSTTTEAEKDAMFNNMALLEGDVLANLRTSMDRSEQLTDLELRQFSIWVAKVISPAYRPADDVRPIVSGSDDSFSAVRYLANGALITVLQSKDTFYLIVDDATLGFSAILGKEEDKSELLKKLLNGLPANMILSLAKDKAFVPLIVGQPTPTVEEGQQFGSLTSGKSLNAPWLDTATWWREQSQIGIKINKGQDNVG